MSEPELPAGGAEPPETPHAEPAAEGYAPSVAARFALYQRAGGIVTPLITALLAFVVGGLVVLATTGKNPLSTYKAIFEGTGARRVQPERLHHWWEYRQQLRWAAHPQVRRNDQPRGGSGVSASQWGSHGHGREHLGT